MARSFANDVSHGMDVYDTGNDKIGTVDDVYDATAGETSASGGGYLRVPTGFLGMGKEHHIPFSAIREVRDGNIYLSISKERLDELGYDEAPIDSDLDDEDDRRVERSTRAMTTESDRSMGARRETDEGLPRTLRLREEELLARKHSVETGAVNLRTEVVSEQQTLEVPVTREEVTIERHAVDRRPSDRPIGESETIKVPVREEQVSVDKQAVVYEEISVDKRAVQETQHVSETVRREEAVIDKDGDVEIEGDAKAPKTPRAPRP
jgi:uncharacterized protein (TIGR02271 family)